MDKEGVKIIGEKIITVISHAITFLIPTVLVGIAVYSLTHNVLAAVCLAFVVFFLCGIFGSGWITVVRK